MELRGAEKEPALEICMQGRAAWEQVSLCPERGDWDYLREGPAEAESLLLGVNVTFYPGLFCEY